MSLLSRVFGSAKNRNVDRSRLRGGGRVGKPGTELRNCNYNVVGESNYQDALLSLAGGYARSSQSIDCEAVIELEPENAYDENAVRVKIDGMTVGYIPASDAVRVGSELSDNGLEASRVDAVIVGGWKTNAHDTGNFGVKLKLPKRGSLEFG